MMIILIVDDSRVARAGLKKALSGLMNMEYLEADSGITALAIMHDNKPDLVFTDWYMEGMDGLEFIQKVREKKDPVRICMVTSEANEERKKLALAEGADWIINKPIKFDELAKALEQLIG
jgi:two-component system, chemotaxis family, chemotaxis protein CheY